MRTLVGSCKEWLSLLPQSLTSLPKQSHDGHDPLYRFFIREITVGRKLLRQVRKDLEDVGLACQGALKQTNHLRQLMTDLTKGTIPTHWRQYKVPKSLAVASWIPDFSSRLAQLERVSQLASFSGLSVWLGGLFYPEAYITATRQAVAHRMSWSLETLALRIDLEQPSDPIAFGVEGLVLEGATWVEDHLAINNGDAMRLGGSQIRWVQTSDCPKLGESQALVTLPVYLNNDRSDVLFTVDLPFDSAEASFSVVRAVCLTAGG